MTFTGVLDTWIVTFIGADEDSLLSSITVLRPFRLLRVHLCMTYIIRPGVGAILKNQTHLLRRLAV